MTVLKPEFLLKAEQTAVPHGGPVLRLVGNATGAVNMSPFRIYTVPFRPSVHVTCNGDL
jgi:hypothetical protein